jgi:hypothetical protein
VERDQPLVSRDGGIEPGARGRDDVMTGRRARDRAFAAREEDGERLASSGCALPEGIMAASIVE